MNQSIYSDINLKCADSKITLVPNIAAIRQSIRSLLNTNGDRLFQPEIDGVLNSMLFDLMEEGNASVAYLQIISAIRRWEPRVELVTNQCIVEADVDNNRYVLTLVFKIAGLDDAPFSTQFSLRK